MTTIEIELPPRRTLAEAVLVVEDDPVVTEFFSDRLRADGLVVMSSVSVAEAREVLKAMLADGVLRIVVLLDLMFDRYDPQEGIEMLVWLATLRPADASRVNVVVRTNANDMDTRRRALDAGARAFHAKSREADRERAVQDVLTYVGRDGLVSSLLLEVVDIDEERREIEIRYRASDDTSVRGTLDLDFVTRGSCIPGGSFWLDTYRRFENDQLIYSNRARPVDPDEDERVLREYLG